MKLLPRSLWTSLPPSPTSVGENIIGLPFFTKPPTNVQFDIMPTNEEYVYRDPAKELHRLFKSSTTFTGVSDIDYNYAIAQNVEGVYVVRGALTKCANTEDLKVLMLIGQNEKPTDTLLSNQKSLSFEKSGLPPVGSNEVPTANLQEGSRSVHVFNLIEFLTERGYYRSRNDGVFGPLTTHAVKLLQLDLDLPNLNGVWDEWCYRLITKTSKKSINTEPYKPVGL
jgi:hypothetical protein